METLSWLLKHELYFPCEIQEKVMLWNTDDGKLAKHGLALRVDESSLILTHNGYLASPAFQFLKITTPEQASLHGTTHKASSYCILELQENDCIAFSAEKSSIYIRDTHIGSLITTLSGHGDAVLALVELRNGNLASGSSDKTIKIWNADDWSLERTLDEPHECAEVLSLAVLKNGLLASGSSQGSILVWNAETGELVKSFKAHESEVCSLVVLQNGCLGSLDASGMVKIWNSETGCLVRSLEGNENVESLLVLASDYLVGFEKEIYIFLPYS